MKNISLFFVLNILFCLTIFSQSNNSITVFTEGGERFFLILNGVKQNQTAETNVKATGINGEQVKAKIIFEQQGIPDCDKTIPLMWAADLVSNTEFVFSINKNKKGQYKWNFVSQAPVQGTNNLSNNSNNNPDQNNLNGNFQNSNQNFSSGNNLGGGNVSNNINNVTTTTTTTMTSNNSNDNGNGQVGINFGINMPGINMNMNVNDGSGINNANSTVTTTTTTSYTTTTTSNGYTQTNTGTNTQFNNSQNNGNNSGTNTNFNNNVNFNQNNNNSNNTQGCVYPMSGSEFNSAKESMKSKSFEDTRLKIAKQVADNNCLSVDQVKGIMSLFSFESNKLEFAKYAYDRCTEKRNYFKVSDAFTFDSSTEELNEYIESKK